VLRLENLATNLRPPASAVEVATRSVDEDSANSYLPSSVVMVQGVPRFVRLIPSARRWRLDLQSLAAVDPARVKVDVVTNSSMPTGAVLTQEESDAPQLLPRSWVLGTLQLRDGADPVPRPSGGAPGVVFGDARQSRRRPHGHHRGHRASSSRS
jgi:hypothetical protein